MEWLAWRELIRWVRQFGSADARARCRSVMVVGGRVVCVGWEGMEPVGRAVQSGCTRVETAWWGVRSEESITAVGWPMGGSPSEGVGGLLMLVRRGGYR